MELFPVRYCLKHCMLGVGVLCQASLLTFSCVDSVSSQGKQAQPAPLTINAVTPASANSSNNVEMVEVRINLGSGLNSPVSELYPILTPDENTMFFVRKGAPENVGVAKKADDEDIWYSLRQSDGSWGAAQHFEGILNTDYHDGVRAINSSGTRIYLQNIYRADGTRAKGFSVSEKQPNGSWSFPEPLLIEDYYNDTTTAMMTISTDEESIILAVQRKGGKGQHDLYVCRKTGERQYSKPELIEDLSTSGSEISPFLAYDDRTIYFSSNGLGGLGLHDVFMSHRLDDTWKHWSTPVNLGAPVNTPSFDAYFMVTAQGDSAYFSSPHESSTRGFGKSDLWKIGLEERIRPGFALPSSTFNLPEKELANGMLRLDNVLFDVGKSSIKSESMETLEKLYSFLNNYPGIKIEVQGHTDNDGPPERNLELSKDRAEAVRDFLIHKGISSNRVSAVGYGMTKPIAPNTTAEGKRLNRRVMVLIKETGIKSEASN